MENAITWPLDSTLNPASKKGTCSWRLPRNTGYVWGDKCQGWERPYPKRRKPCCRTPETARSSAVPPSQGWRAQTSPGSHYGTSLPGTFCGAWWVCKPLCCCCWVGDGRPESYWGSWWRQRAGLGSRFPSIHVLHKLMFYKDLEESVFLRPVLQTGPLV